jgi:hypothetical protein
VFISSISAPFLQLFFFLFTTLLTGTSGVYLHVSSDFSFARQANHIFSSTGSFQELISTEFESSTFWPLTDELTQENLAKYDSQTNASFKTRYGREGQVHCGRYAYVARKLRKRALKLLKEILVDPINLFLARDRFYKALFWPKTFRMNFHAQILDKSPPKKQRINLS